MRTVQHLRNAALSWLPAVLILTWPSNLFLKFLRSLGYVNGISVDYLIPKLYLSDCLMLAVLALWLVGQEKKPFVTPQRKVSFQPGLATLWLVSTIALLATQFLSISPLSASIHLLRLLASFALAWFFYHERARFSRQFWFASLWGMIILQTLIGSYQFLTQHSLAGYWLLGEPEIPQFFGISQGVFGGEERYLAYGTTPHPNVLAGTLVAGWLGLTWLLPKIFQSLQRSVAKLGVLGMYLVALLATGWVLYITQSLSATLAMVFGAATLPLILNPRHRLATIGIGLAVSQLILVPWLLYFNTPPDLREYSISRRNILNQAAIAIIQANPFKGVGLLNFSIHLAKVTTSTEVVQFIQPVHHVGLLWLSETGLVGIVWFGISYLLFRKKQPRVTLWSRLSWILVIFAPLAALDHYLLTLPTGLLFLPMLVGILAQLPPSHPVK